MATKTKERSSTEVQNEIDVLNVNRANWQIEYDDLLIEMSENLDGDTSQQALRRRDLSDNIKASKYKLERLSDELIQAQYREAQESFEAWCKDLQGQQIQAAELAQKINQLRTELEATQTQHDTLQANIDGQRRQMPYWVQERQHLGVNLPYVKLAEKYGIHTSMVNWQGGTNWRHMQEVQLQRGES